MKKASTPAPAASKAPLPPASGKGFNPAQYARPGVSEQEIVQIKEAFDLFDTDQGGSIDTNQLKAAMVSLGFETKNAVIFQMIADLDEDGNKQIDFEEWIHLMTFKISPSSNREALRKLFPLYDDEKTDHISIKNLRRVAMDLGIQISQEQLDEMIKRADVLDRDGLVNFEQFYTILTRPIKE